MGLISCVGFVQSNNLIRIINVANAYNCKPSDILHIQDDYVAFCFNEVVNYITTRLKKGDDIHFEEDKETDDVMDVPHVSSLSDFYNSLGVD